MRLWAWLFSPLMILATYVISYGSLPIHQINIYHKNFKISSSRWGFGGPNIQIRIVLSKVFFLSKSLFTQRLRESIWNNKKIHIVQIYSTQALKHANARIEIEAITSNTIYIIVEIKKLPFTEDRTEYCKC